jgi:hypothetical protein
MLALSWKKHDGSLWAGGAQQTESMLGLYFGFLYAASFFPHA